MNSGIKINYRLYPGREYLKSSHSIWNEHYTRLKSRLSYPDENLVRILSRVGLAEGTNALDFGSGSGRHSFLLKNQGFRVTALDSAENSLEMVKELVPEARTILSSAPPYPFSNKEFDLIVSWGALHYNSQDVIQSIVSEYKRILKDNGVLAGTIRADRDTHLSVYNGKSSLGDISGADVNLFSEAQVRNLFIEFSSVELGYMERTPIGKLEERICHWIFLVKK
ncbi:MAG: class I SAM-dependent methyltransferase [Leptospiraceae bacterium]|nr:class I SAM-dependent methyltransferase [Leptospiraceae bacterium]